MNKAAILDFFAGLNLVVLGLAAAFYILKGINVPYGGTGMVLTGLSLLFAGLFQYAILGGAAEIIKRLASIDEGIKGGRATSHVRQPEGEPLTPAERVQVLFGQDLT